MKKSFKTVMLSVLIAAFSVTYVFATDDGKIVYKCRDNTEKKIALTFDDGPHPENTEKVLDLLDKYGIPATFFVIGENAEQNPELIEREIEAGHEVGNHTYYHNSMNKINKKSLENELSMVEDTIRSICSYYTPTIFRPPGGVCSNCIIDAASDKGYNVILWTVDTEDWRHRSADNIEKNILTNVKSGSIILCHDYVTGEYHSIEALERVIPKLMEEGYVFVTVSELISL